MDQNGTIFIGRGTKPVSLSLELANGHGLITGHIESEKTSLQVMAEGFARAGVPVFVTDITGELSGLSEIGQANESIIKRAKDIGLDFQADQFSTVFWDVFGEQCHPVRAT